MGNRNRNAFSEVAWSSFIHLVNFRCNGFSLKHVGPDQVDRRRCQRSKAVNDLPTSRAQIFSRARSVSGRFFMFLRQKRTRERELVLRAGANYRNRKCEAKDFEKV